MIDINVYQVGMLLRLLVSKFYKRASNGKKSAIITQSSIVGTQAYPGAVMFSATKAFTLFYTMGIGFEINNRNFSTQTNTILKNQIDLQCLCSGPQAQDMALFKASRKTLMLHDFIFKVVRVSPSKIVNDSLRDLVFCNVNHNQTMFTRGHWSHDFIYKLKNDTFPIFGGISSYLNYILFLSMGDQQKIFRQ